MRTNKEQCVKLDEARKILRNMLRRIQRCGDMTLMKYWIGLIAAVLFGAHVQAQSDRSSGAVFYSSCMAAADIFQGKRPAADSPEAANQLRQAAICFGAVTAIMNVEPLFKPEFTVCPPTDTKITLAQMILAVTARLKNHPEQRQDNFHRLAATALAEAWLCSK